MIISFAEFNALYESLNDSFQDELEYNDGAEILEALFTVIQKKGSLTEQEVATFLDNVLDETEYDLNTEVYESYLDWLEEYSHILDEGFSEENGYTYSLTKRGEGVLNELGTFNKIKTNADWGKNVASAKGKSGLLGGIKGALGTNLHTTKGGHNIKLGHAIGGAAAIGGGALAARALIKRHQAKKAAAAAPPAPAV